MEPPRRYSVAAGLPEGGSEVYSIDNEVVFSTDAGLFSYDAQGDRFLPDERFGQVFADGSRWVGSLLEDVAGRAWLTWGTIAELQGPDAGYDMHLSVAGGDPLQSERWNGALERIKNQRIFSVIPDPDDAVWIALEDGLLRFDLARDMTRHLVPEPVLTRAGVEVYAPSGKKIASLAIPERPANVTFGGKGGRTLFITARTATVIRCESFWPAVGLPRWTRPLRTSAWGNTIT